MTRLMQPPDQKDDRADRLAVALRENLRRRKAQARGSESASADDKSPLLPKVTD